MTVTPREVHRNELSRGNFVSGLNVETLRNALDYNPETGVFLRIATSTFNPRVQVGSEAGFPCRNGYRRIRIGRKAYFSHRLAWFYVHGEWPKDEIDHINGVRDDNRIANLRQATRTQNLGNTKLSKKNTSGIKGVIFDKANAKWMAYIMVKRKFLNLGRFDSKEAARAAREVAHRKAFGEFLRA